MTALVSEWLQDLKVTGRSPRTIKWYSQKMRWYLQNGGVETLEELTPFELKGFVAQEQDRKLAAETVRGTFATLHSFAVWAAAQGYEIDAGVEKVKPPKVPFKEMQTYTPAQIQQLLEARPRGWQRIAYRSCSVPACGSAS